MPNPSPKKNASSKKVPKEVPSKPPTQSSKKTSTEQSSNVFRSKEPIPQPPSPEPVQPSPSKDTFPLVGSESTVLKTFSSAKKSPVPRSSKKKTAASSENPTTMRSKEPMQVPQVKTRETTSRAVSAEADSRDRNKPSKETTSRDSTDKRRIPSKETSKATLSVKQVNKPSRETVSVEPEDKLKPSKETSKEPENQPPSTEPRLPLTNEKVSSVEPSKATTSSEPAKTSATDSKEPAAKTQENSMSTGYDNTEMTGLRDYDPGELTENLSDLTYNEYYDPGDFGKRSILMRCMRKVCPQIRNNLTLFLFVINVVMIFFVVFLIVADIAFLTIFFQIRDDTAKLNSKDIFTIYHWSEWGPCSATCKDEEKVPLKARTVLNCTSGNHDRSCPSNVMHFKDYAPCNVYSCPRNLSTFNFTGCFPRSNGKCYAVRDLEIKNDWILVDTRNLSIPCPCPKVNESAHEHHNDGVF